MIPLSAYLVFEAMRELSTRESGIETPLGPARGVTLTDYVILAPVLRAGLVIAEAAQGIVPAARTYHIGLKRDEETLEAVSYYAKLPDTLPKESRVYILDPMLATGGSAEAAIKVFTDLGLHNIHMICFLAAPEGIKRVTAAYPDIRITTAAIDDHLNEHAYIVPGLGDAGDRIFGT